MPASEPDSHEAAPRFKRRKTTHTKRVRADDSSAIAPSDNTLDAPAATSDAPQPAQHEEGDVPNLKDILRNRKRVRDFRGRELGPRRETGASEAVKADGDALGLSGSGREGRFVRQTGQVVDTGDREMAAYVEARLAEQNHLKYGWPIPPHLAAYTSSTKTATTSAATNDTQHPLDPATASKPHATTTAAGHGKLEEVPVPRASNPPAATQTPRQPPVRLGRDGKPFRPRGRPRRTSVDLARDALVESILSESRVDFFAPPTEASQPAATDEDLLARFEAEYRDAAEERMARKPPEKGAGDAKTGPKLGGSRSQRAAMAAREKEGGTTAGGKGPVSKR